MLGMTRRSGNRLQAKRWRRPRWLLLAMVLALPLIALVRQWLCHAELEGHVTAVTGGQHLAIGGTRVTLNQVVVAVDRERATSAQRLLRRVTLGEWVRCGGCRHAADERLMGWCELEDGTRLARTLVDAGLARDCPATSGGLYAKFEKPAAGDIKLLNRCRPWMRRGPRPPIR